MSIANYDIFELGSEYWKVLTDNGKKEVPSYIESIIKHNGVTIDTKKHPIRTLEKGVWIVNYSENI